MPLLVCKVISDRYAVRRQNCGSHKFRMIHICLYVDGILYLATMLPYILRIHTKAGNPHMVPISSPDGILLHRYIVKRSLRRKLHRGTYES